MAGCSLVKVAIRPAARLVLHLDGGVFNLIMLHQIMLDLFQQSVVIVWWNYLYMQRHQRLLPHHPYMHMMHIAHFRDFPAHTALKFSYIQRNWRTFK